MRRCTPSIFLRFVAKSEPGFGVTMTEAVVGFWSSVNSSVFGHHEGDADVVDVVEGEDVLLAAAG